MFRRLPLVFCLLLGACSSFQRSPRSGYADSPSQRAAGESLSASDTHKIAAEMGYDGTLSGEQLESVGKRRRLRQLENALESNREREQYSKVLPWLNGDDEKIELLSIPSLEGRQAWINSKQIWSRSKQPGSDTRQLIEAGDISVGMAMEHVKKAWGEPQSVDVSGNPIYKNERWRYVRYVSSPDGYRQEKRFVYFEGGRVVGWETE